MLVVSGCFACYVLIAACVSHGVQIVIVRYVHRFCMVIADLSVFVHCVCTNVWFVFTKCCMVVAWLLLGHCLIVAWLLVGFALGVAW